MAFRSGNFDIVVKQCFKFCLAMALMQADISFVLATDLSLQLKPFTTAVTPVLRAVCAELPSGELAYLCIDTPCSQ